MRLSDEDFWALYRSFPNLPKGSGDLDPEGDYLMEEDLKKFMDAVYNKERNLEVSEVTGEH